MVGYRYGLGFSTLTKPIPWVRVHRLPMGLPIGFPSEFKLRSTATDVVDFAFYHSYAVLLDPMKVAGHIKQ